MSKYIEVLNQMIQKNYPNQTDSDKIIITNIQFQILYPKTSNLLEKYLNLKTFVISNCDLRNLQNFPLLSNLELLDLSNNQLQGTFNHLMKCKNLTYINLSNNIISEPTKLAPLKRIGNITICINDNPLCFTDGYANKIKNYNIKITKSPKKILQQKSITNKTCLIKQESKKKQKLPSQLGPASILQRSRSQGNDLSNLLLSHRNISRADQLYNINQGQRRSRLEENRSELQRRLERMESSDPQRVRRIRQRLIQREQLERQRTNRQNRVSNYFDRQNRHNLMNLRVSLNRSTSEQMSNIFFRPNLDLISDSLDPSSQLNENVDNEDDEQDQLQVDQNISKSQEQNQQEEEQEEEEEEDEDIQNLQSESQLNNLLGQQNDLRRRINLQMNEPLFLIDRVNLSGMSDSEQVPINENNQDEEV